MSNKQFYMTFDNAPDLLLEPNLILELLFEGSCSQYSVVNHNSELNSKQIEEWCKKQLEQDSISTELLNFKKYSYNLIDVCRFQNDTNLPSGKANYYYISPDINWRNHVANPDAAHAFFILCKKLGIHSFSVPITLNGHGIPSIDIKPTESKIIIEEHRQWVSDYNVNRIYGYGYVLLMLYFKNLAAPTYKCLLIKNNTDYKPFDFNTFENMNKTFLIK